MTIQNGPIALTVLLIAILGLAPGLIIPLRSVHSQLSQGNIVVADVGARSVFLQSLSGGQPTCIFGASPACSATHYGTAYNYPWSVALAPSGDIIVADADGGEAGTLFRQSPNSGPPTVIYQDPAQAVGCPGSTAAIPLGAYYTAPQGVAIVPSSTSIPEYPQGAVTVIMSILISVSVFALRLRRHIDPRFDLRVSLPSSVVLPEQV